MAENKEEILDEAAEEKENPVVDEAVSEAETAEEAKDPAEEDTESAGEAQEEEDITQNGDANDGETNGAKKSFFKKKKDKKDEQIEELNDKVKRQIAEFENFRKRTDKEKTQMYDMGAKTVIEKILPVVDNFERGLAAVPEEQKEDAFVTGMDKIYKQLMTELETIGVTPIEAVGVPFDPEFHNAVMQVENAEYESGVVAQELQKGYKYKETVVRHSMVAVVS